MRWIFLLLGAGTVAYAVFRRVPIRVLGGEGLVDDTTGYLDRIGIPYTVRGFRKWSEIWVRPRDEENVRGLVLALEAQTQVPAFFRQAVGGGV